eukprot:609064-Amphidinium_carterae.1
MFECIKYVFLARPRAGVFENVEGWTLVSPGHENSPCDLVMSELRSHGYHSAKIYMDQSAFTNCVRKRTACTYSWPHVHVSTH